MLVDDIKKQITSAMKGGDTVARDILRLALGEIQTAAARPDTTFAEEDATAAVRKLIKANQETLALTAEADARTPVLRREIEVLVALLPAQLTVAQIVAALSSQGEAIKAAGNDGQATGVAMKALKASGASVNGTDVTAAVKQIRS